VNCRYTTHWTFHLRKCLGAVRRSGLRAGVDFSRRLLGGLWSGSSGGDILRIIAVRRSV
jgi:hypothetical protein